MKKLLILLGLAVAGGAAYSYRQAKLLMDYSVGYVNYKIISKTIKRITIQLKLKIENKSDIKIIVTGFDFNIYLNGIYTTRVKSSEEQVISANDFSIITLLVDVEPLKNKKLASWNFLQKALSDILGIKIKTEGTLSIKAFGVSVKDQPLTIEMPLRDMIPDKKNQA